MSGRYAECDAEAERLERRWFAAFKAASSARGECEALLEAMELTENAWNQARIRLAELEALRDELGEQLDRENVRERETWPCPSNEEVSAA